MLMGGRVSHFLLPHDTLRRALDHVQAHLTWRRGVVASVVRRMNEDTLRRARLIMGWVTVFGQVYHHGM